MSDVTLLTPKEAGRLLRRSHKTLARDRLAGSGPPYFRIGGQVLYNRAELIAWLETRRRRSTSDPGPDAQPVENQR